MPEPGAVRNLLVVSAPAAWIPAPGQRVAGGVLAVERASSLEAAGHLGAESGWDVVAFRVEDLRPLGPGQVLAALRAIAPEATFLPVATASDPQEAIFYLKQGAFEYLVEPLSLEGFLRALGEAIENRETFREILDLNRTLEEQKTQLLVEKAVLERKNRELEAVSRVARALASTLDLEEILRQLGRDIQDAFGFPRVVLGLLDRNGAWEEVREEFCLGSEGGSARGHRWALRDGRTQPWIRTVLQKGAVLRVDAPADHPDVRGTLLATLHPNPFAKVPMVAGGRVLGTVTVETAAEGDSVSDEVLGVLRIFADTAAVAVGNARLYQSMVELSVRDELTGLYNRRHLAQQLEAECVDADRHGNSLSVLLLDIDHFKQLNDRNDHLTGDAALRRLAATLLKNTRGIDTVARYGGEEFVLLLPRAQRAGALIVAEKLRRVVEATVFEGEEVMPGGKLTVSLGLATCPEDGVTPKDLLERADWALYRAKSEGRNRVRAWEAEEKAEAG